VALTFLILTLVAVGEQAGSISKPELFSLLFLHLVLFAYFRTKSDLAVAVGDLEPARTVLEQLEGPLRVQVAAPALAVRRAYLDGYRALARRDFELAQDLLRKGLAGRLAGARDRRAFLLLEQRGLALAAGRSGEAARTEVALALLESMPVWYVSAMRTTIDGAGRVVIPKELRNRLALVGGQELEIREREGRIEIEPAGAAMTLRVRGGGLVAVPDEQLPPLTDEIVRETLERARR